MKKTFTVLTVLTVIFITSSGFTTPKEIRFTADSFDSFSSFKKNNVTFSTSDKNGLRYVRVRISGRWWIYVYNGTVLVNAYPE